MAIITAYRLLRRRGHATASTACVSRKIQIKDKNSNTISNFCLYEWWWPDSKINVTIIIYKPLSDLNFARCLGTCPLASPRIQESISPCRKQTSRDRYNTVTIRLWLAKNHRSTLLPSNPHGIVNQTVQGMVPSQLLDKRKAKQLQRHVASFDEL